MPLTPAGPHAVGCRDWAWQLGPSPISSSNHVVGRLLYPAAPPPPHSPARAYPESVASSWVRSMRYAKGYVDFAYQVKYVTVRALNPLLRLGIYVAGALTPLPVEFDAPLAPPPAGAPYPLVVFSHGAGSNANTYSALCADLASRGFVVVCLEHADGSSGATRLADGTWTEYQDVDIEGGPHVEAKCAHRVDEVMSAVAVMRRLNSGAAPEGKIQITGPADLAGSMDFGRLVVAGHSMGGATAVLAASSRPEVAAAVALDPWWTLLPSGSPALTRWLPGCRAPLLVIGSDEWNTPQGPDQLLHCNMPRQLRVFEAARRRADAGGGALFMVPTGSTHVSFTDVPAVIEARVRFEALRGKLGFKPTPGRHASELRLIADAVARFLGAGGGGGADPSAAAAATAERAAAAVEARLDAAAAAAAKPNGAAAGKAQGGGGGVRPYPPVSEAVAAQYSDLVASKALKTVEAFV